MDENLFHEHLKQCSIYSYGENLTLPKNYRNVNHYENPKSGFSASVIKNDNDIIIAYRGSDSRKDWTQSNKQMWFRKMPAQAWDAVSVYLKVKQQYPNAKIYLTGHSLGGSLAQIVGLYLML